MVGTYIRVNKNAVGKSPKAFKTPTVAAPAPNIVSGPLNRPSGAIIIKAMARPRVVVGKISPRIGSKKGAAIPEILLNIGSINKKPNKEATSITPS